MERGRLPQRIGELEPGDHLCWLYDAETTHRQVVTSFVGQGLERGEQIIYLADSHTPEDIALYLREDGVDVDAYLARGQLLIAAAADVHPSTLPPEPGGMIAYLHWAATRSSAGGYTALRITGEMSWAAGGRLDHSQLARFERGLGDLVGRTRCVALCQYDLRRFAPAVLLDVLGSHQAVLVGTTLYDNFYYVPPADAAGRDPPEAELQRRLRNLVERQRATEELRRSEERYRTVVERANEVVAVSQANVLRFVNARAVEMTGHPRERLIGRPFTEFLHPDDRAMMLERHHRLMRGERLGTSPPFRVVHRSGRTTWVRSDPVVIQWQGGPASLSLLRDVTEQVQAEEALQRSQEQTAHGQRLLLALSQAAQTVQRARTAQAIYRSIGREVRQLGYQVAIFTLSEDREHLTLAYETYGSRKLEAAERLMGLPAQDYRFRLVPGGFHAGVLRGGEAVFSPSAVVGVGEALPDPLRSLSAPLVEVLGIREAIYAPLQVHGEPFGLMAVMGTGLREADAPAVTAFANQASIALENARLLAAQQAAQEQLHDLAGYLQTAREEERARIAREIHDELGQTLTALKMELFSTAQQLPAGEEPLSMRLAAMSALVDATIRQVRRVATELRPGLLDDLGLAPAMEWQLEEFGERTGIACELRISGEEVQLGPDLGTALFRIFQEALTNVARHAEASRVQVELDVGPDEVRLEVRDDGRGITDEQVVDSKSLGLMGMRERVRPWDGQVTFQGTPRGGTTVTVRVPSLDQEGDGA